jgi:hypothetical protein
MAKMKLSGFLWTAVLILALIVTGCDPNKLKQAKTAGLAIERTADTVLLLIPTFQQGGEISPEDAAIGIKLVTDFKTTVHQFNARAATYTTFDEHARADLLKLFQDITAGLAVLNDQGVLRIKNPKLKGRVQIYLAAAQLSAGIIADALEQKTARAGPETGDRGPAALTLLIDK